MPSFVIHLAVGQEYMRKHPKEIKEKRNFVKGVIAPDLDESFTNIEKNKAKSHYGIWGNYNVITQIDKFLKDKSINTNLEYKKGYFLHLLTDHYFYNIDFNNEYLQIQKNKDNFYFDYDCLNRELIKKYQLDEYSMKDIKKFINFIEDKPKYLEFDKIVKFIDKMSSFSIDEKMKIIEENGMEGINNEHKN